MGIRIVAGPGCGGKSTYVRDLAGEHDMIVDYDDIVVELGGRRYYPTPGQAAQAGRLWITRVNAYDGRGICWLVWAHPSRSQRARYRERGARVIVVKAPLEVCLARAEGTRPPHWPDLIRDWFTTWQPSTTNPEPVVDTG